ncbi:hypothetical protein AB0D63_44610 [Kitasatospora sp. NPDC048343]|uniref:hypothetical protein n=1 Tax=Kitasatospora sp. NPDC048343 TaxID=3154717 RepID=UPI0033E906AA
MSKSEIDGPITVLWGQDQVTVSHVTRELPDASDVDDRAKLVKAGMASLAASLPEDAWYALGRACVTPQMVAVQLRESAAPATGLLLEEHVDGATLRSVHSRVWLTELFPGIQPRTGQDELGTSDPQVIGVAEEGQPQAILRYRYRDPAHLKQHIWQTIFATIDLNSYEESILARRVTRALIVHPVIFEFEDDTEPISALIARDGITRLASAWKVLAGPGKTSKDVADLAAEVLFDQTAQQSAEPARSLTQLMALKREAYRKQLRAEFTTEWSEGTPSLRAIQIAQTYSVPAHVAVGVRTDESGVLAAEDVFDDAMRSILASVHVEFKPWDAAAQNLEVATRALKAVAQTWGADLGQEDALRDVYALAVGRLGAEDTPRIYGNDAIPGTELWRATYLIQTFTRPSIFKELRDRAKEIKGDRRMSSKGYAGLLGPVVDVHWRSSKKSATKQARNAWSNGGALCEEVLAGAWRPVPTADFTSLVEPALKGDLDARCTLAVAGGTALIADKLITRNVGSAVATSQAPGKVPFRADVSTVIGGLARQDNELGLWILALAAQRFQASRPARNESIRQELGLRDESDRQTDSYQYAAVDLEAPDRIRRDGEREVPLTQWDIVSAPDPERARKATAPRVFDPQPVPVPREELADAADPQPLTPPRSVLQQIVDEREHLADQLASAKASLEKLAALGQQVSTQLLLGRFEEWNQLREDAIAVAHAVEDYNPERFETAEDDEDHDENR